MTEQGGLKTVSSGLFIVSHESWQHAEMGGEIVIQSG